MVETNKLFILVSCGIGGFALLLLIISVATPVWLDDYNGDTVGLFRQCYGSNITNTHPNLTGCFNINQVTQGGLSIFGLLLLVFSIITGVAGALLERPILLWVALGLMYFASMFVMSAYATWGTYSRDPVLYGYPQPKISSNEPHTSMGSSYHLCVAAHYFLWTALTLLAFAVGVRYASSETTTG